MASGGRSPPEAATIDPLRTLASDASTLVVQDAGANLREWVASRRGQSRLFGLAGLILGAWMIFSGRHWFPIALSASAPWIALAINRASGGEFGFERWITDGQIRWSRGIPRYWDLAAGPVIALFVFGLLDFNPVDLAPFAIVSLLFGSSSAVLFFTLVVWPPPERKFDWVDIGLGTVGFFGYAFGCMSILNGMLPQPPPSQFEARINSKYIKTARNQPRMFVLGPFGPFSGGDVRVTLVMYDHLQPGDSVCMLLHAGGLGFEWWEIAPWTARQADPHCYPNGTPPPRRVATQSKPVCKGEEVSAATCS